MIMNADVPDVLEVGGQEKGINLLPKIFSVCCKMWLKIFERVRPLFSRFFQGNSTIPTP